MSKKREAESLNRWSRGLLLFFLMLVLQRLAMANAQTADDAVNCSGMALASTLISPEKLSSITKLSTDYVETFYSSMHMVSQMYFGVYVVNRGEGQPMPTNREIFEARAERLRALSFQYERDPDSIRRLYLWCDAWAISLSAHLESIAKSAVVSEEEAIEMFRSAPEMVKDIVFGEEAFALGAALADAGFRTFIDAGRTPPAWPGIDTSEVDNGPRENSQ